MDRTEYRYRMVLILIFGIAVAYFEAAVVVYLRELFYPEGFSFPLQAIPLNLYVVEFFREVATMVILLSVAGIAGRKFWERFGYFIILFGTWDIFYYVWLKVTINWPSSLFDWDILFLIPVPWIGPVIAPVLVSVLMIGVGLWITSLFTRGYVFMPTALAWALGLAGTAAILFSFVVDTEATLRQQMPQPYLYSLLVTGLILYAVGFLHSYRSTIKSGI